MNLAYHYAADRIWIVNVGDLKPMEFPMEFFLNLAWAPERWPKERIHEYSRLWAEREFGPEHAAEIAGIISKYTKYNGRRKPELLEPGTFSPLNYQEADTVLADWKSITEKAEQIYRALPESARDAFYQLVLYPAKACYVVNDLYITVAKTRLYASQGRASANDFAARARGLFKEDAELSDYFNHKLANGKWSHMMDQTHIGYTYWQQPPKNTLPTVTEIKVPEAAEIGVAVEGSASVWPGTNGQPVLPEFGVFNQPRRYIDVFNKGRKPFRFSATTSAPWIVLSQLDGTVEKEQRLWVSVDWSKAPTGKAQGLVKIAKEAEDTVSVQLDEFNPAEPASSTRGDEALITRKQDQSTTTPAKDDYGASSPRLLRGFVEADGYVSIEAEHYAKKTDAGAGRWEKIEDYGRTLSAMTIFPVTAASVTPPQNSPCLEYQIYLFTTGKVEAAAIIAPTLNFAPGRGLRFAVSFDDETPQVVTAVPKGYFVNNGVRDWEESVKNNCLEIKATHQIETPGYHALKIWMVDPGVVLEKIVVNTGGVKPSYLGPPESYRR